MTKATKVTLRSVTVLDEESLHSATSDLCLCLVVGVSDILEVFDPNQLLKVVISKPRKHNIIYIQYSKQNNSPPIMSTSWSLESVNGTWKKGLRKYYLIELRILRWTQGNHKGPYRREAKESIRARDVVAEAVDIMK